MAEQRKKVVLAYSGGLDTSVAIKWIPEKYNMDVITVTIDLGAVKDLDAIREKALKTGAKKAIVIDAKDTFVKYFVFPALQAGALYEGVYPLATALGRPLIAKLLADVAHEEKADAVAHGCTGKGNDQVRLDVSLQVLNPKLRIIAPVREWKMTRDEETSAPGLPAAPGRLRAAGEHNVLHDRHDGGLHRLIERLHGGQSAVLEFQHR